MNDLRHYRDKIDVSDISELRSICLALLDEVQRNNVEYKRTKQTLSNWEKDLKSKSDVREEKASKIESAMARRCAELADRVRSIELQIETFRQIHKSP